MKEMTIAKAKKRLREIEKEISELDDFLWRNSERVRVVVGRAICAEVCNHPVGVSVSFKLGS